MLCKAVIFDLDGVLIDACEWHYQALNSALTDLGYSFISRNEHFNVFNGLPTKEKLIKLGKLGRVRAEDFQQISNLKQAHTLSFLNGLSPDLEKIHLLTELKRKFKLGCVSNSVRNTVEIALKNTGLFDFFDVVLSNEDVPQTKPSPLSYLEAMKRLEVSPLETIIVEDADVGRRAARDTGCLKVITRDFISDIEISLFRNWL